MHFNSLPLILFLITTTQTAHGLTTRDGNNSTLYQHYTAGGINSGLVPTPDGFLLNGKPFRILSGAMHYFRVHPAYWRDRLRKMRAAGLTAVDTYVAWNLHEPQKDVFDFGDGDNDMSFFLDLVSYIKIAQEEDLFVIFRPGPYICSEWDFGGLPSWLLRDHNMRVRTSYGPYQERAFAFFEKLIPLVTNLQFTSGGSIIAVQVENEYGAFGYDDQPRDRLHLQQLLNKMKDLGLSEMFFTSDSPVGTLDWGAVPGVLQTVNFKTNPVQQFIALLDLQPNMPLMVTEFWSGWFDHWTQEYHDGQQSLLEFNATLSDIFRYNSSVNFYMFHGGTNFGFMNGANFVGNFPNYLPDVTSYDYDSPLTEAGDYTLKYDLIADMIKSSGLLPGTISLPARPLQTPKIAYKIISLGSFLTLNELIEQVPSNQIVKSPSILSMEELPINDENGQSYGFIVYRKSVNIQLSSVLKVRNHIRDLAQVLVNGILQTPPVMSTADLNKFGSWFPRDASFTMGSWRAITGTLTEAVMDLVVENLGRVNYGKPHDFHQKKGLWEGPVLLDGQELSDWEIIPLEFKKKWVQGLTGWKDLSSRQSGPLAVRFTLTVTGDQPLDTFLDMSNWGKGVVFVNGFNLGRYWSTVGPQKTLYLPGPLLNIGLNTIIVYEQYQPEATLTFKDRPDLGPSPPSNFQIYDTIP